MVQRKEKELGTFTPALDILLSKYGPMTAIVYGYIKRRSMGERGRCDSNRSTIKKLLHIDEKTFTTHARKLAQDGYVKYQERGNSSTIYWITGKAEIENAYFSVEIFPTKRDSSEEILHGSGENFPSIEENLPTARENLPDQQGNFTYEESIEDTTEENKKERRREERGDSPLETTSDSLIENNPVIELWKSVVKPLRLSKKEMGEIVSQLGDNPDKERLSAAFKDWCGRVDHSGKSWSKTNPVPILERYINQSNRPKTRSEEIAELREFQDDEGTGSGCVIVNDYYENGERRLVWSDGSTSDAKGGHHTPHPTVDMWITVVKPSTLNTDSKKKIIEKLGDRPDLEILQKAVSGWQEYARDKKNKNGKPYSLTFTDGILERYDTIAKNRVARENENKSRNLGYFIGENGEVVFKKVVRALVGAHGERVIEFSDGTTQHFTEAEYNAWKYSRAHPEEPVAQELYDNPRP